MMTPRKGDYGFVPMTPEARKVADAWDPDADQAGKPRGYDPGHQHRPVQQQ